MPPRQILRPHAVRSRLRSRCNFVTRDHRFPANDALAVVGLTLLALAARLPYWNMPVQCDEASLFLDYCHGIDRPIYELITHRPQTHNHPLLTLLTVAWWDWLRVPFPAFRLPTLVVGVAVVPLTFLVFRRAAGRRAALLAAVGVALASFAVRYSIEARGYGLAMLMGLATVAACLRARQRTSLAASNATARADILAWVFAGVVCGVALYALIVLAYLVAAILAWIAVLAASRRMPVRIALRASLAFSLSALIVGATLYAPMVLRWGLGTGSSARLLAPWPMTNFLGDTTTWIGDTTWMFSDGVLPAAVAGVLMLIGAVRFWRDDRETCWLLLCVLLAPIPCFWIQRVLPPDRAMTYAIPYALLLAAVGFVTMFDALLRRVARAMTLHPAGAGHSVARTSERERHPFEASRLAPAVAIVAAIACFVWTMSGRWPYPSLRNTVLEDYRPIAAAIQATCRDDRPIFAQSGLLPSLRYHLIQLDVDPARVRLPRAVASRTDRINAASALLVYRPSFGLSDAMQAAIADYSMRGVLFEADGVQLVSLERNADPSGRSLARVQRAEPHSP